MTVNFVPRDIYIRHENEWQSVREAADEHIDIGKRPKPSAASGSRPASIGKSEASAARPE
ncbi:hypothetical protein [Rhizobium sp. Pop5]|uniref:hypothetical protein n=1 Tax=Rhizobium sp. Pop5 TaxID=1223565 RepID=UPI00028356AF|nr:hypothetical protein RCCGEPOP_26212 [Rhizobium sp. Pop5]